MDGTYPADFRYPKRVDSVKILDNSQLDRIMQAYNLPHDRTSLQGAANLEPVSSTRARIAKLHISYSTSSVHTSSQSMTD
ncbi:MAG: hypothetical protein FRX48_08397 [Lasallia pustulata]|uniref:Uncharacterized protein n=1 Tax=Lasallia pustulata TaxID=136370 RepID=A0A5M8PGN7_9LECA|nr:MAG: hypothetical protein FRX48_08397 [Lasallia pustulata]